MGNLKIGKRNTKMRQICIIDEYKQINESRTPSPGDRSQRIKKTRTDRPLRSKDSAAENKKLSPQSKKSRRNVNLIGQRLLKNQSPHRPGSRPESLETKEYGSGEKREKVSIIPGPSSTSREAFYNKGYDSDNSQVNND
jgi:hypothetical protein